MHYTSITARGTAAANTNGYGTAAADSTTTGRRNIEPAIAATTADALRQKTSGPISLGLNVTLNLDSDRVSLAAISAGSANTCGYGPTDESGSGNSRCDRKAASAATTPNALCHKGIGIIAKGKDITLYCRGNLLSVAAAAPAAANANCYGAAAGSGSTQGRGHAEAAIAATAANGLGKQAGCLVTSGHDTAAEIGHHQIGAATITATAAYPNGQGPARCRVELDGPGHDKTAITATTADTLRHKTVCIFATGFNPCRHPGCHLVGITTVTTGTAHGN
jgi:hypothetical protein